LFRIKFVLTTADIWNFSNFSNLYDKLYSRTKWEIIVSRSDFTKNSIKTIDYFVQFCWMNFCTCIRVPFKRAFSFIQLLPVASCHWGPEGPGSPQIFTWFNKSSKGIQKPIIIWCWNWRWFDEFIERYRFWVCLVFISYDRY